MDSILNSKIMIQYIYNTYNIYIKYGATSSKKVNYFHSKIKEELEKIFLIENGYEILLEYNISSYNSSGKKRCDIVILKNKVPYIVLPVKIVMSNYKQNKNNNWENLTGELLHMKWKNEMLHIIPINIFMNNTPYLSNEKKIIKYENITIKDIENYNILIEKNICYDIINYIIDVEHQSIINEKFLEIPKIVNFNKYTKYRDFNEIFKNLI